MILLPFFLQVYRTFGLKLQFFTLILNMQENTNANFYQKGNTVMIYTDTHLHSSFSSDSDTPMELMIKQGIRLGMKTLCFTEHYDPCYPDTPDGLDFLLDFENYKKRTAKHMDDVKKFAAEPLMKDLVEVADNFERAIASADKADKDSLMAGIKNTHRQFVNYLESNGLTRIPSEPGTEFDPHVHEAVAQIPTDEYPEETIINVLKTGYMLHGKVLRPATVTISVPADGI